jgi:hypothetical protein
MHEPSNIRPVSAREILSRAATHLQMVDREAVSAKDAQHVGAAHSLLDLLLMTEPVPFMPAQPLPSLTTDEVDALRYAPPDLVRPSKRYDLSAAPHVRAAAPETEAERDRLKAVNAELLAVLKRFRTKVYNAAIGNGMDDEWATAACSVADAAIAKAEGGAA